MQHVCWLRPISVKRNLKLMQMWLCPSVLYVTMQSFIN